MKMRSRFVGISAAVLGLALCLGASAQTGETAKDKDEGGDKVGADQNAGRRETIRGIIAGVTVEGETVIDTRSNRAVTAEMDYLTIVGSPRHECGHGAIGSAERGPREAGGDRDRDRDRDRNRDGDRTVSAPRRRHNVYIVRLTPKTQIREAMGRDRDRDGEGKEQSSQANVDTLEIGDHVEVTFLCRDEAGTSDYANAKHASRRHGRHRTYFGDALTITLLPDRGPREQSATSHREEDRNRGDWDRDRNKDDANDKD
ncbi:MAG: hypothetical protein JO034_13260 [Singulisphaera sp.]|nr:hypothetical protein [Singulisphaera sp.]